MGKEMTPAEMLEAEHGVEKMVEVGGRSVPADHPDAVAAAEAKKAKKASKAKKNVERATAAPEDTENAAIEMAD